MEDATCAAIVCRSVFLRDMVADNLQHHGVRVVSTACEFSELSEDCKPDIVVAVETSTGELARANEAVEKLALRFDRWLVIGSAEQGSIFQRLRAIRSDISGVPLDIGTEDMYHAVTLAANTDAVCIGGTCCNCVSTEMHKLKDASLDRSQWEILKMLADGATNKHIANRFSCDENKVKGMIRRLLGVIDAANRTQAAVIAARAGL
ncbi:MAG: LuxR C-terminal-related transcriptional regulator [Sulfitobacter sp.]